MPDELTHVRPVRGRRVRLEDNARGLLPEAGARVHMTQYWLRRIADGDVEVVQSQAPARAEKE